MSYVKKYGVGRIMLDLPYANYIHELPLLSFGDVQHTINLSLVYNYEREVAEDNSLGLGNGFKLNIQKRIIKANGEPTQLEEGSGKLIDLMYTCGGYTFDDKTQRVLRVTSYGYEIDHPDFSKETYNNDGFITGVYSKYDRVNPFLTYGYTDGKLTSITYRGTKTINLIYTESNELATIAYAGQTINFVYGNNELTVKHFSGVDYHFTVSGDNLVVYSANQDEAYSNVYSHRITCTKTNNSISIIKEIGAKTIDSVTYDFLCFEDDKVTLFDVTNKNGVKTRNHLKDKELLYSYEMGLENEGFVNDKYCGDVQIQNVLNNTRGISVKGVQKHNDGVSVGLDQNITLSPDSAYENIYILSGWIKALEENTSDTVNLLVSGSGSAASYDLPTPPYGEWTYFSIAFPWNVTQMCLSIENADVKDLRIAYQPVATSVPTNTDTFFRERDVLVLENTDGTDIYLYPNINCQFYNGSTIISDEVTMRDVLQYKINQMYGTHKNVIFYDDCKKAVTSAGDLCVKYTEDGTVNTVSVKNLAVGKFSYVNGKEYVTKTNFYLNDEEEYNLITKSCVNGECYKEDVYNEFLDVVSTTVEDASVHYDYVSGCGLISKRTTAPKDVDKSLTTRADVMVTEYNYDEALTKTESIVNEFGSVTSYTTDDTWGIVTAATLPDGTVVSDNYDSDACALLSREFAGADNARATSFEYSGGNPSGISHGDNDDSIGYGFTYDGDKLTSVNKSSSTVEEHEHTDTTLDSYYPTKAGKLYSVLSDFDKYGRLTKTDSAIQNTYDVKCEYDSSADLISCSDNGSALLATSKDLAKSQTAKYQYNAQRQLIKKQTVNSSGTVISEEAFDYDEIGRLTSDICTYDKQNGKSVKTEIRYEKDVNNPLADNTVNRYSYYLNDASSPIAQTGYDYDSFNRIVTKFCAINGKEFNKDITYDKSRPRQLFESLSGRPLLTLDYTYDNMGRIASEANGNYITTYTYDEYGQLVREDNQTLDKSFQYVYNGIGNIVSVKTYGYTPVGTELGGTPTETKAFTYGDTANPDRLTSYNGADITYNANGGVATYNGYTYSWSKGRLSTIYKSLSSSSRIIGLPTLQSSVTYSFGYNGLGQRISSNYNYVNAGDLPVQIGELTSYSKNFSYDHSGRLIHETNSRTYYQEDGDSYEIVYLYDESGVVGMVYTENDTSSEYYFQRNLMGDIVAIYDTNGAKVAAYTYDAWGNCKIASSTTNYAVALANPFRYRGYYFDSDTNLYYLNARYYSPEFRRFISPDDTAYLTSKNVNGCNLYCYCGNDPVNFVDPSGHEAILITAYCYYGLPIVGHTALAIRDVDGLWYIVEYGGTKSNSQVIITPVPADEDVYTFIGQRYRAYNQLDYNSATPIEKLFMSLANFLHSKTPYTTTILPGDYYGALEQARIDEGTDLGGYSLIFNNCAQYINNLLKHNKNNVGDMKIFYDINIALFPTLLESQAKAANQLFMSIRSVFDFVDSILN